MKNLKLVLEWGNPDITSQHDIEFSSDDKFIFIKHNDAI